MEKINLLHKAKHEFIIYLYKKNLTIFELNYLF